MLVQLQAPGLLRQVIEIQIDEVQRALAEVGILLDEMSGLPYLRIGPGHALRSLLSCIMLLGGHQGDGLSQMQGAYQR